MELSKNYLNELKNNMDKVIDYVLEIENKTSCMPYKFILMNEILEKNAIFETATREYITILKKIEIIQTFSIYIHDYKTKKEIVENLNHEMQSILLKCLEFDFINELEVSQAINILSKYTTENDFFSCCSTSKEPITKQLILGSQI